MITSSQFVGLIFFVICLAGFTPSIGSTGGILKPEITVKYIAVSIIFLNSGLTLPTEHLASSILRWDIHLFIQVFTFVGFPFIGGLLTIILQYSAIHPALLDGITILSTMPPPVSSAIILTKAVGGNEGAAVFNSVFGSILGIVVTPFLILMLLGGKDGDIPTNKIFQQLFLTVVIPLLVGQMVRNYQFRWIQRQQIPFGDIGKVLILFIIYTTFCDTFSRTDFQLNLSELIIIITIMCGLLLFMKNVLLMCSYYLFDYAPEDAITIMYVGAHKNLALGIPMIEIIFEGSPRLSFLSIPLLIYNPAQIVIGAMSIGFMQNWLFNQNSRRRHRSPSNSRRSRSSSNTRRTRSD